MYNLRSYFKDLLGTLLVLVAGWQCLDAQIPFTSEGQIFITVDGSREFGEIRIDPSNNAIKFAVLNPDIEADLWVMGFRNSDRLVYGFDPFTGILYRIDATGTITEVTTLDVDQQYFYGAGDISPDGRYLKMIGSQNDIDEILLTVDLDDPDFASSSVPLPGGINLSDIAYDPMGSKLYGLDQNNGQIVSVDPVTAAVVALGQLHSENDIFGMYFDAFMTLYGFGTSTNGVASAIFSIDDEEYDERRDATGPVYLIQDLASAALTVDLQNAVTPRNTFPCTEIEYTYRFGNTTGVPQSGLAMTHPIPPGLTFQGVVSNPLGGFIDMLPGQMEIRNLTLPPGTHEITVRAEVGDIDGGQYPSQAELTNLPPELGMTRLSDNPATIRTDDPTQLEVIRAEEDSVYVGIFLCQGESIDLDGTQYGTSWKWNNGSNDAVMNVGSSGDYILEASSGCQTVVVTFDVSVASCPFTIEVMHDVIPRETLPCSEVIFRFIVENDAGEPHAGIDFRDTLPEGFSFVGTIDDAMGGEVIQNSSPRVVDIRNMTVPLGFDTLSLLIAVDNLPPGEYRNQAVIRNFPQVLGPLRFSDDPATHENDSTTIIVLGVSTDTLVVDEIICSGAILLLDGTPYGIDHHWFDGSRESQVKVDQPGLYELVVFDGCEPTYIFFDVNEGDLIDVFFSAEAIALRLGDSVKLSPQYVNDGDSLWIRWSDPLETSLSCDSCLAPMAIPLSTVDYTVFMGNGVCTDSAQVTILLDNSRRVYFPNIFSPNNDGVNDYYFIQSPDFGNIEYLAVYDRWGQEIYHSKEAVLNAEFTGWNGTRNGKPVPPGVYLVHARITFLDGITESFGRTVTVVR